jgi:putative ABC transport system permease protein
MYLHDRVKDEPVHFDEYSVLLSEKLADVLSLSVGDTFQLENGDEKRADFTVTGITENYAGGYVYIGAEVYRKAYEEVTPNLLLIKSRIPNEEQNAVAEKLLTSENVSNVEFHSQTKSTYDSLLESLGYLIAVLIIAAGALAVIVLYNLTNININERMKELATLRVLGYHNKEVAVYIFREITILSILGTAFGLLVGFWLHRYIILCAETVEMMFGREIRTASFVWSAVLTLIFSAFVNVLMLPKIKKIDMTESMKAVD